MSAQCGHAGPPYTVCVAAMTRVARSGDAAFAAGDLSTDLVGERWDPRAEADRSAALAEAMPLAALPWPASPGHPRPQPDRAAWLDDVAPEPPDGWGPAARWQAVDRWPT